MTKIRLNPGAIFAIGYAVGAAAGIGLTFTSLKRKFKKEKDFEVEEIRTVYRNHREKVRKKVEEITGKPSSGRYPWIDEPVNHPEDHPHEFDMKSFKKEADDIAKDHRYTTSVPKDKPILEETKPDIDENEDVDVPIYTISPSDFNADNGYAKVFLTYFSDGALVDDAGDEVSIVPGAGYSACNIPREIVDDIGKYEEDIIHCRDENLEVDYEITADPRRYFDLPKRSEVKYEE